MTARGARVRSAVTGPRLAGAMVAVALLCGMAAGLMALLGGEPDGDRAAAPPTTGSAIAPSEPVTTVEAEAVEDAAPTITPSPPPPDDSMRLTVPSLGIDAPIVPVGLQDGGVLDPPSDVADVGWWDGGAAPGDETGQTVLTGHTVHDGGGVMDDLDAVGVGARVRVSGPDGVVDYRVSEVAVWTKTELAGRAVETFGQDRHHGRLVLVTCEDWNGSGFDSNVVVTATPVAGTAETRAG